jgi:lipopolysaccharide export system protein LptC
MKRIITLIVFMAVAVIAWWSSTDKYGDMQQPQQVAGDRYIEVFMNSFELIAMDESGSPAYILNGEHLQKYNNTDDTEIQQPVLQLLQRNNQSSNQSNNQGDAQESDGENSDSQNNGQWKISANSAIINDKNETIQLEKNVVMQQQNIEPAVTIHTQNLLIHTKTQIAQTDAQVEIMQGRSHFKSKGMVYNNISSQLELTSNVSGHYLSYD